MTFDPLVVDAPAPVTAVDDVERRLGQRLPPSFRRVLSDVSAGVHFAWFAPAGHMFPKPFGSSFSGALSWSLETLPDLVANARGWIEAAFPDPADPYDHVWHDKLPFMEVGNGDYLAIDLDPAMPDRVVYLSHDDGEGHGLTMAAAFEDLLDRWIPLACPGAEDWQWLPFHSGTPDGIDPAGPAARMGEIAVMTIDGGVHR